MASWGSWSFLFGPLVALAALVVIVALLRWTFRRGSSVVARPADAGSPDSYGTLVPVAEPPNEAAATAIGLQLAAAGLRSTPAHTTDGWRVLVFARDERRARDVLSQAPPSG